MTEFTFVLPLSVFLVAMLYSSVGHGGASGYLAILSLMACPVPQMATTALILNMLVSGIASTSYIKAKHLSWRLTWPFIVTSIPAAFVGGLIHISSHSYFLLLAVILALSAVRLAMSAKDKDDNAELRNVTLSGALSCGAGIGILSGLVGIGGGIFLSPLMLLMRWANAKQTSATSACFIFLNSLAGLGGRALRGALDLGSLGPLIAAAFVGGIIGSHYGANVCSGLMLRRLLAGVLLLAAFKLIITLQ